MPSDIGKPIFLRESKTKSAYIFLDSEAIDNDSVLVYVRRGLLKILSRRIDISTYQQEIAVFDIVKIKLGIHRALQRGITEYGLVRVEGVDAVPRLLVCLGK